MRIHIRRLAVHESELADIAEIWDSQETELYTCTAAITDGMTTVQYTHHMRDRL